MNGGPGLILIATPIHNFSVEVLAMEVVGGGGVEGSYEAK